jgi:hypothetical protein
LAAAVPDRGRDHLGEGVADVGPAADGLVLGRQQAPPEVDGAGVVVGGHQQAELRQPAAATPRLRREVVGLADREVADRPAVRDSEALPPALVVEDVELERRLRSDRGDQALKPAVALEVEVARRGQQLERATGHRQDEVVGLDRVALTRRVVAVVAGELQARAAAVGLLEAGKTCVEVDDTPRRLGLVAEPVRQGAVPLVGLVVVGDREVERDELHGLGGVPVARQAVVAERVGDVLICLRRQDVAEQVPEADVPQRVTAPAQAGLDPIPVLPRRGHVRDVAAGVPVLGQELLQHGPVLRRLEHVGDRIHDQVARARSLAGRQVVANGRVGRVERHAQTPQHQAEVRPADPELRDRVPEAEVADQVPDELLLGHEAHPAELGTQAAVGSGRQPGQQASAGPVGGLEDRDRRRRDAAVAGVEQQAPRRVQTRDAAAGDRVVKLGRSTRRGALCGHRIPPWRWLGTTDR